MSVRIKQTQDVIARVAIDAHNLRPGDVCQMISRAPVYRMHLCFVYEHIGVRFTSVARLFLPMREFLARQPKNHFWTIMDRENLHGFISDPRTITWGPVPFRFESEGEALYYANQYDLKCRTYLLGSHSLAD